MLKEELSDSFPARKEIEGASDSLPNDCHGYVWGLFLVILAFVVPRVEVIYADFGIPLPRLTILVIRASHLVNWASPPAVAISLLLLVLLGADWLMLNAQSERGEEGWSLAWSMFMFASPLLLIGLTLVALVLPLLSFTTRLSGEFRVRRGRGDDEGSENKVVTTQV